MGVERLKPSRSDAMMGVKGEVLCEKVTPIPHSDLDVGGVLGVRRGLEYTSRLVHC